MIAKLKIGNRIVGEKHHPLIIAEIGINHNGSLDEAISIAESAIKAGAEVIKHQTHIIDDEMIPYAKKIKPGNSNKSIYEIISKCALNEKDEKKLMKHITNLKKIFISTPFSRAAANRLQKFNVPAFKIGSGECNNYPLIEHVAKFKKPIILSTGMNSIEQIKPAVKILRRNRVKYALLHCTNIYPTPPELVRLNCLSELKKNFKDAVIGLSDHTSSNFSSYGALALGASIIEKHLTLDRKMKGPDHKASLEPDEFKLMVKSIRNIEKSLGSSEKKITRSELGNIMIARKSIVAKTFIKKGEKLSISNITVKRPAGGLSPMEWFKVIGKKAKKNFYEDDLIET